MEILNSMSDMQVKEMKNIADLLNKAFNGKELAQLRTLLAVSIANFSRCFTVYVVVVVTAERLPEVWLPFSKHFADLSHTLGASVEIEYEYCYELKFKMDVFLKTIAGNDYNLEERLKRLEQMLGMGAIN